MTKGVLASNEISQRRASFSATGVVCGQALDQGRQLRRAFVAMHQAPEQVVEALYAVGHDRGVARAGIENPIRNEAVTRHVGPMIVQHDLGVRVVAGQIAIGDVLSAPEPLRNQAFPHGTVNTDVDVRLDAVANDRPLLVARIADEEHAWHGTVRRRARREQCRVGALQQLRDRHVELVAELLGEELRGDEYVIEFFVLGVGHLGRMADQPHQIQRAWRGLELAEATQDQHHVVTDAEPALPVG